MGFLFLIIVGLGALIAIAQLASKKVKPSGEEVKSPQEGYSSFYSKPDKIDSALQKALISLLLKKEMIQEDELLEELEKFKK